MTTVVTTIEGRTFLSCVQRIVAASGETRPGSLVSPTDRVYRAMMAVNNAYDRIWNAAKWPFRHVPQEIALVANKMWYELPEDFQRIKTPPCYNSGNGKLTYLDYEVLLGQHPDIRSFPPGGDGQSLTTIAQHTSNSYFGIPSIYTLDGNGYLGLFLVPSADFIADQPYLQYRYWRVQPSLFDDGDVLEFPKELWYAHHLLALGEYKQMLEYSDSVNDLAMGEAKLNEAIAMYGLLDTRSDFQVSDINYNE